MTYDPREEYGPLATMADAHREWHLNAGVPMGQPGCPQDACHLPDDLEPPTVKCGNKAAHGGEPGYHYSPAEVRACYQARYEARVVGAGEPFSHLVSSLEQEVASPAPAAPAALQRVSVEEMQAWRSIPVGRGDTAYYALETADHSHVAFFRVRRPSKGKYAGRTYVDQQSGDTFERMPFRETAQVLSTIAKNPAAAATLYGQKIQRCAMCHRSLTDDVNKGSDGLTSLERGIGPDCMKKVGLL